MSKTFTGTEAEWRKAFEAATAKTESGFMSRRELVVALGLTETASLVFLRKLHNEGRLESRREGREGFDGMMHPVAVYRIKKP